MNENTNQCDVLIIGAGPGGCTAGPLLAEKGYKVVMLEKDHHPRFHIGESLLPNNLPIFDRLGIADEIRAIGLVKPGAEFSSPEHDHIQFFDFSKAYNPSTPYAYHVLRSQFDEILVRNAQRKGVEVHEGCLVTEVIRPNTPQDMFTINARYEDHRTAQWKARFLIDASGRDTFMGKQLGIKTKNPKHNSAAVFAHYHGVSRNPGHYAGNISVYWFPHGWFWVIPMQNDLTSVGMVTWPYFLKTRGQTSLDDFLTHGISLCPKLEKRIGQAQRVRPAEAAGNYSYSCTTSYGDRFLLIGDAYTFIDPVFSSGVMLAMTSGMDGAEVTDICLRHPQQAPAALEKFARKMRHGPKEFSWFIYRVTNPIFRDLFMSPRPGKIESSVLSILAGDIFGNTPIWRYVRTFKLLYFIKSLTTMKRAWLAWRQRAVNIRPT